MAIPIQESGRPNSSMATKQLQNDDTERDVCMEKQTLSQDDLAQRVGTTANGLPCGTPCIKSWARTGE